MKNLDQDLNRMHFAECDGCGWTGHWDEFDELEGRTVCEECWEREIEEDPSLMIERVQ